MRGDPTHFRCTRNTCDRSVALRLGSPLSWRSARRFALVSSLVSIPHTHLLLSHTHTTTMQVNPHTHMGHLPCALIRRRRLCSRWQDPKTRHCFVWRVCALADACCQDEVVQWHRGGWHSALLVRASATSRTASQAEDEFSSAEREALWELIGVSRQPVHTAESEGSWHDPCTARQQHAHRISFSQFIGAAAACSSSSSCAARKQRPPSMLNLSSWAVAWFLEQGLPRHMWATVQRWQQDLRTPPQRWLPHVSTLVLALQHRDGRVMWLWIQGSDASTFAPPLVLQQRLLPHTQQPRRVLQCVVARVWVLHRALNCLGASPAFWSTWRTFLRQCWHWCTQFHSHAVLHFVHCQPWRRRTTFQQQQQAVIRTKHRAARIDTVVQSCDPGDGRQCKVQRVLSTEEEEQRHHPRKRRRVASLSACSRRGCKIDQARLEVG